MMTFKNVADCNIVFLIKTRLLHVIEHLGIKPNWFIVKGGRTIISYTYLLRTQHIFIFYCPIIGLWQKYEIVKGYRQLY